jgi:protein TonB
VLALLLAGSRATLHRPQTDHPRFYAAIEIAGGSHAMRMPLPVAPVVQRKLKIIHQPPPVAKIPAPAKHVQPASTVPAAPPASEHMGTGTGQAFGSGTDADDVDPAFPVFSPRPAVTDRSLLPSSEQKIVIDVKLNEQGDVVDETLVRGMGNSLDGLALAIVKTWRFHPAMVNGKPVASEAECIFPFNPNYPVSPS